MRFSVSLVRELLLKETLKEPGEGSADPGVADVLFGLVANGRRPLSGVAGDLLLTTLGMSKHTAMSNYNVKLCQIIQ